MRAILAGGGTGGHVIPALAIAQQLRSCYGAEVIFIGTPRGIEGRLVPNAGFPLYLVKVGALINVSLKTRAQTLWQTPRAIARAAEIIGGFRPDVMIGVGGYASGPGMLAAAMLGVRTVAFSPDAVPGFTNRVLATMISAAAVQFEESCRYFRNCHVTGVPVRQSFFDVPPRPPDAQPTLLVFGGSQGAHAINLAMLESLTALNAGVPGLHIIHQTGERDYPEAAAAYLHARISAEVSPFIDNMPDAFARADLLLCRSGASTLAEITAAGRASILVPLPTAADDHQRRNAEALSNKRAALLLRQSELTSAHLVKTVTSLLRDRAGLQQMAAVARQLSHPNAARDIADLAARVAGV
jgi:UDP-N-acetylglucosamine--N-acetylmuramyl-(pentapeptide) pyrophosphoryl-undecaprenol N-acetylglucosamine transferase